MIFSSLPFIFGFLPVAFLGFLLSSRFSPRAGAIWLVLVSLGFYAAWRMAFLPLLLISIGFNYGIGQAIAVTAARPRLQFSVFLTGILFDLCALGYFKYAVAMFSCFGMSTVFSVPFASIVLPLGISFFTFTQIGYLVDVKQGTAKTRDPLTYILFVTFFPHLIAGPILHNREMMPQFANSATYQFSAENFAVGITMFCIGLVKKVALADPLSADVSNVFSNTGNVGAAASWYGIVAYSLQLYFDFSGYSDMAIGIARMFNIRFPLNFASPYKATSIIEFWQRWHITLTRFITMYIFSPIALAITRARVARGLDAGPGARAMPGGFLTLIATPTLITMGLAGVWHGAGFQFIIFGLLHGIYIVVNHAARIAFPARKDNAKRVLATSVANVAKVLLVYVSVLVSFCFFRSASTQDAFGMLSGMLGLHGMGVAPGSLLRVGLLLIVVWALPNTQQIMCNYAPALGRTPGTTYTWLTWRPTPVWALACALLAAVSLVSMGGPSEFLYFQF